MKGNAMKYAPLAICFGLVSWTIYRMKKKRQIKIEGYCNPNYEAVVEKFKDYFLNGVDQNS
jgi:hypothetical protein